MSPPTPRIRARLREVFAIDLRSLAALRIALALILLGDLATRAPFLGVHYPDDGVFPRGLVELPWHFSIYALGGATAAAVLYAVAALFALALLVGWRTRLATVVSWVLVASLQVRSPLLTNNGDILLRMLLLWGIFLPLGARWSLDARRREGPALPASVLSVGTVAVLVQFFFLYLSAGVVKNTKPWRDGTAVQLFLGNETLGRPLGTALRAHPAWTEALTYATVAFELAAVFLLFSPWRTSAVRLVLLPCFWLFQLGLATCLQLQLFPISSTAATLPFLPARFWELFGSRTEGVPVGPDPWTRTLRGRAGQLVAGALLAYTALLNAPTLFQQKEWEALETMAPARMLGIVQSWRLYSWVPRSDTSFEIVGQRADGRIVDVLGPGGGELRRWMRRVHTEYRIQHQLVMMTRRHDFYRPLLRRHLAWICEQWNAGRAPEKRLARLQFVRVERRIELDHMGPPERSVVAEHACSTER